MAVGAVELVEQSAFRNPGCHYYSYLLYSQAIPEPTHAGRVGQFQINTNDRA